MRGERDMKEDLHIPSAHYAISKCDRCSLLVFDHTVKVKGEAHDGAL